MQHYTAETSSFGSQVGIVESGYFQFLCNCAGPTHETKTVLFTDLTPVKFVPQDASMVGDIAGELEHFIRVAVAPPTGATFSEVVRWRATGMKLLAQIKSSKPEEPKTYGSAVMARVLGSGNSVLMTRRGSYWYDEIGGGNLWNILTDIEVLFPAPDKREKA